MATILVCALVIVLPALAAILAPRRMRRIGGKLLVALLAGFAIRLSDGPQVFDCSGWLCLDDGLLARALGASAVLLVLILVARWVRERDC